MKMKILIITSTEKSAKELRSILATIGDIDLLYSDTCEKARVIAHTEEVDIAIINSPLADGMGDVLAERLAAEGKLQPVLILPLGAYEELAEGLEQKGVFVLSKPISTNTFYTTMRLAYSTQSRLKRIAVEKTMLQAKLDTFKLVDRAKCCLIQYLGMTEGEAHKYIEKRAMNTRTTAREVAEQILKTYEN